MAGLSFLNMKWIPGRVKDSDYYVNYDYEMWGKVSRLSLLRVSDDQAIHFWRIVSISKLNTIEAFRKIVVIYKTYSLNLQKIRYDLKPVYFG